MKRKSHLYNMRIDPELFEIIKRDAKRRRWSVASWFEQVALKALKVDEVKSMKVKLDE